MHALYDDGDLFIYLNDLDREKIPTGYVGSGATVTAWLDRVGVALEPCGSPVSDYEKRHWWRGDWPSATVPERLVVQQQPRHVPDGATLKAEFAERPEIGSLYDAEVSQGRWRELIDEDDEAYDPMAWKLYEPRHREDPVSDVELFGFTLLEGQPDDLKGWKWTATLPTFLRRAPEYHHLFPGSLEGFRGAVARRLEGLTDLIVKFYTHNSSPSIYVQVPGGKGYVFSDDKYVVPRRIVGATKAEAVETWKAKLAEIEADVRAKSEVCPHCMGTGRPEHTRGKPRA